MKVGERLKSFEKGVAALADKYDIHFVIAAEAEFEGGTLRSVAAYPDCPDECKHPNACHSSILQHAADHIQTVSDKLAAEVAAGKVK